MLLFLFSLEMLFDKKTDRCAPQPERARHRALTGVLPRSGSICSIPNASVRNRMSALLPPSWVRGSLGPSHPCGQNTKLLCVPSAPSIRRRRRRRRRLSAARRATRLTASVLEHLKTLAEQPPSRGTARICSPSLSPRPAVGETAL
eukprot:SAG11_NODE_3058_length_2719_cov_3.741985_2_plen_145_part_01